MLPQVLLVLTTLSVLAAVALGGLYLLQRRQTLRWRSEFEDAQRRGEQERRERERVDEALRQKKEWSDILFNNTQDMVFIHGVTPAGLPGHIVQVNDVACRRLGHPREKLLASTPLDMEEDPMPTAMIGYTRSERAVMSDEEILERQALSSAARHLIARILEEKQVLYERTFVTRTGRRFPVEISARRFDLLDEPMIMCTAHDITERRRAHRALQESERLFQDFFAHSPIGVAMYDADRRLINVNPACLRMFGTPETQEFARFDLFDNTWLSEQARRSLRRGENVSYEASVDFDDIRRSGLFATGRSGKAHFDLLVHNLGLDQDYKPKGFLAQIQDTTRRREAESALVLSERQLRRAQKMEAIGTLAGGIAHDFNNILTPIMGYAEIVMQCGSDDSGTHEYLREILKASHRAKDLVNQILTFSRQAEREGAPIQMHSIIREVVKQVQASLPDTITARTVFRSDNDVVVANATQLHQIVMNLCTNAVHAMQESGGTLEIATANFMHHRREKSAYPALESGPYLQVSVRDTGVGMDAATLERIFEPFFTTKASGEGTGMGLAVVHGIVSSLKGTISVESTPGAGATFHVVLPCADRVKAEESGAAAPMPTGSGCVLFVDDEKDIVKMAAHMLTRLGYEPVPAAGGDEALRLFRTNPARFDAVITDQVMPGLQGLDLARDLLALRPELPIILCTGFSESVTLEQVRALGVREFMLKPLVMRQLAEALSRILSAPTPAGRPASSRS